MARPNRPFHAIFTNLLPPRIIRSYMALRVLSGTRVRIASRIGFLIPAVLVGIAASSTRAADSPQLVWADEFEVDGPPNPEIWDYEHGFERNEELQWYQPANARCEAGLLVIEARRERMANPRYREKHADWRRNRQHAEYTSASINTRNHRQWLYGRFEMRARIDVRPGLWPAFWTLGTARGWPGSGEIDIMEYYDGKLLANAAWLGSRGGRPAWDSSEHPLDGFGDEKWAQAFHIWRMDWNSDHVRLYVDDKLLNEIDVAAAKNSDRDDSRPFREPHYILLNLAIGGTRGGDPSKTKFPARFEVDYVRVFQQCEASKKLSK